jgi:hypothetical protein
MTSKKPLILNQRFVTVGVADGAQRALRDWAQQHNDTLTAALEPFGLTPYDIVMPTFEQHVYIDDTTSQGTPGIYRSRLCVSGAADKPEPVVLLDEDDRSWLFWLPDTYPAEDWRGDRRWFPKDGATFTPLIAPEHPDLQTNERHS